MTRMRESCRRRLRGSQNRFLKIEEEVSHLGIGSRLHG